MAKATVEELNEPYSEQIRVAVQPWLSKQIEAAAQAKYPEADNEMSLWLRAACMEKLGRDAEGGQG